MRFVDDPTRHSCLGKEHCRGKAGRSRTYDKGSLFHGSLHVCVPPAVNVFNHEMFADRLDGSRRLAREEWFQAKAMARMDVFQPWQGTVCSPRLMRLAGKISKKRARRTRSVGAAQPAHGELNIAGRQFAPAFHRAHVAGLRITGQKIARLRPRLLAWQREGLAQITVIGLPPCRHAVGQIPRAKGHVVTPKSQPQDQYDKANISMLEGACQAPSRQLALPVLVLDFAAGALVVPLFGASLRTTPQGSDEPLASGIFLSDSL